MRPAQIMQVAAEFDIKPTPAFNMRIRYLQSLLGQWFKYMDEQTNEIPESDVMTIIGELTAIREHQDRLKKGIKLNEITDEMIQIARDYPIESLIEFVNGKAIAFCHADKNPSLTLDRKRGKAHCFVCDKDYNALDVLIERDNMSFVDAVKQLQ